MSGRLRLIERAIDGVTFPDDPRVIDVAAGDGAISEFVVSRTGGSLVTCDHDAAEVRASAAAGHAAVLDDVLYLPFADAAADITVAFEIIEHFKRPDAGLFVKELHRVTAPGGTLLLSTPNRYSLESWKGVATYLLRGTVWNARDSTHVTIFSRGALLSALRPYFDIERCLGYFLVPEIRGHSTPWTYHITSNRFVARLSHKLFVVARRRG
jgi:2-polyprenyl-3-methyl-5-hydroxy-6-metoxy-1,4-benzoquinol methylase